MNEQQVIDRLNKAAEPFNNTYANAFHGSILSVDRIVKLKSGKYVVKWNIKTGESSVFEFSNPPHRHNSLSDALKHELSEIEERIMANIFATELFPYLEGIMLRGKGRILLTIKEVNREEVSSNRGSEPKYIIRFEERDKGLILNKTNAKAIAFLYGEDYETWPGQRIYVYAEEGTWFGEKGYAVRVAKEKPPEKKQKAKKIKKLTDAEVVETGMTPASQVSPEDEVAFLAALDEPAPQLPLPEPSEPLPQLPLDPAEAPAEVDPVDESENGHLAGMLTAETFDAFCTHAFHVINGYFSVDEVRDMMTQKWPPAHGQKSFRFTQNKIGEYVQFLSDNKESAADG